MSAILYNMRYRGPYEYDKFTLNIFQTSNEVRSLLKKIKREKEDLVEKKEEEILIAIEKEKSLGEELNFERERIR